MSTATSTETKSTAPLATIVRIRGGRNGVDQGCDEYIGPAGFGYWDIEESIWAPPTTVADAGSIIDLHKQYEQSVRSDPDLLRMLPRLKGKKLGCWCDPIKNCHGNVLLKLLQEME